MRSQFLLQRFNAMCPRRLSHLHVNTMCVWMCAWGVLNVLMTLITASTPLSAQEVNQSEYYGFFSLSVFISFASLSSSFSHSKFSKITKFKYPLAQIIGPFWRIHNAIFRYLTLKIAAITVFRGIIFVWLHNMMWLIRNSPKIYRLMSLACDYNAEHDGNNMWDRSVFSKYSKLLLKDLIIIFPMN